ncbi:MAG: alpha/beta fold hydrolase [Pseudomonadota bacterium]
MNPIVWLHGAGLSSQTWSGRAEGLCLDLPGHGDRPRAARPEIAAYSDALLPDLPDRFALVGHSLGGMVALDLAARFPERVYALVLAETAYSFQERKMDQRGTALAAWIARRLGPQVVARLTAMGQKGASRKAARTEIAATSRDGLADAMMAVHRWDGADLLPKIVAPTLVLVGRRNPRTHPQARIMAKRISDARLMTIEAGHFLHTDAPHDFYPKIRDFVRSHSPVD